jgi:hypothetical protein
MNLYKIYASEFNKPVQDIQGSNSLPSDIQNVLTGFIYDNLISRIMYYLNDIEALINNGKLNSNIIIPTVVKNAFDDTIVANSVTDAADAIDPVVRLKYTVIENANIINSLAETKRSSTSNQLKGVVNIDKDQLQRFIDIIKEHIENLFGFDKRVRGGATDTHTKLSVIIDYVKSITYILIFDRYSQDWMENLEHVISLTISAHASNAINVFYRYSHIPLSSAICIYAGMVVNIEQDKNRCSNISDSFRFFKLVTAYSIFRSKVL